MNTKTTVEMPAPPLPHEQHYYAAASRWDSELIRNARVARNQAYLFAAASWLVTMAAAIAMVVVFTRQKVEVVTIAFNDATQTVSHVRYSVDEARRLTGMDAVRKFHLNQWVLAGETWSPADVERRVETMKLMSAPEMEEKLGTLFGGSAQDRTMGRRLERAPKVHSISLLKDGVAHVQFQTTEFIDGKATGLYEWAAIVEFRFTHKPVAGTELLNPFGFQVTNYRRDAASVRNP